MAISKVKATDKKPVVKKTGVSKKPTPKKPISDCEREKVLKEINKLIEKDAKKKEKEPFIKRSVGGRYLTVKEKIQWACKSLERTLIAKNCDYGNSALTKPTLVDLPTEKALAVRLGDKIKRLRNLLKDEDKPKVKESLDDTLKDIAGYAILWLVARAKR